MRSKVFENVVKPRFLRDKKQNIQFGNFTHTTPRVSQDSRFSNHFIMSHDGNANHKNPKYVYASEKATCKAYEMFRTERERFSKLLDYDFDSWKKPECEH